MVYVFFYLLLAVFQAGTSIRKLQKCFIFLQKCKFLRYRKIPKISPGAYTFQSPFLRGLLDWASLIVVGRKFTIFALFYFVFEGKFQVQGPRGAYIRRGNLTEGFLRYDFGGLIFGGAYTQRGLFSEFYGMVRKAIVIICYTHSQHSLEKLYNSIIYSMCMPVHVLLILKYLTAIL